VKPHPKPAPDAGQDGEPAAVRRELTGLWRRAFGDRTPGGASSTPSPTRGRSRGISAPGVAKQALREGAQGRDVGADGPVRDMLHATQRTVLHPASAEPPAPSTQTVQPTIRRYTGDKRTIRVGPLRFTPDEHALLRETAIEHGYKGESGFAADITLAFLTGRFTANLPLSEDRRRTHMFRARVLRALSRIGNNVNQIARALNSASTPPDIRERLDELHHLLTTIAEALAQPTDHTQAGHR